MLAILGGLVAGLAEAFFDANSLLWWPKNIPLPIFTAYGVQVPAYVLWGYSLFLGVGCWVVYETIRDGRGARGVWTVAAVFFVADLIYEIPFSTLHLYRYYGPQPFKLGGFPLYWAFLNSMVVIVGGWMFWAVRGRLVGWGQIAGLVIPMFALGPLCGAAWPTFLALHASVAQPMRWVAALFTMGVSAWIVQLVADVADDAAIDERNAEPLLVVSRLG
jgi:hypothetical protein